MRLQEKLDGFTTSLIANGQMPEPIVKELMDGIADQIASGHANHALRAGQHAPSFVLKDANGNLFSSADHLRRGPLVVTFYRGVWCPYCNMELASLEAARSEIECRGATLVAVSMQNAAKSRESARRNNVGFPILVDVGGTVAAQFGLRYQLTPRMVALYKTLGNDLQAINDDDIGWLPMPGRYVIAQDGIVTYSEVNPDYTKRPDPSDLLLVLDQLIRQRAMGLEHHQ